jgi:hypothetical protein
VRLASGHYPREAESLRLPADPFAPGAALRFGPDGAAVRIWSVGPDGRDQQGSTTGQADVVLARE